ncbi:hypothetical protein KJ758_03405 [Patescibacteria group bacterium]|nr:hypothetical protein [Patescibacteria group bacterium]
MQRKRIILPVSLAICFIASFFIFPSSSAQAASSIHINDNDSMGMAAHSMPNDERSNCLDYCLDHAPLKATAVLFIPISGEQIVFCDFGYPEFKILDNGFKFTSNQNKAPPQHKLIRSTIKRE